MAAIKLPRHVKLWIAQQKAKGHEICYTKNGHPYAVLKKANVAKMH